MLSPVTIYFASGNPHKVRELQDMTQGQAIDLRAAIELGGMPPVIEDTGSFVGNAFKKARALHALAPMGAWVLADDSGLCVDALRGLPGVESAYYAGPNATGPENLQKLFDDLAAVPLDQRAAQFYCVFALIDPQGVEYSFEGTCNGTLALTPRGEGLCFDPLFVPLGYSQTFGELSLAQKRNLSHRGIAFARMLSWLQTNRFAVQGL